MYTISDNDRNSVITLLEALADCLKDADPGDTRVQNLRRRARLTANKIKKSKRKERLHDNN